MINTSIRNQAGCRGRECVCATLWRGTRPQSLLGKKAAAQEMWCNGAPRFVHSSACQGCVLFCSLRVSESRFQLCGCGWLQYIRLCWILSVTSQITPQAFSARTSPFIHISINQLTTFQYMVLYLYSIIQSTLTRLCPLSYRKTHLFEYKTTPHSCAITIDSSNPPTAKILRSHYSLVFFGKLFHIYVMFPSNLSSDICLCVCCMSKSQPGTPT